MEEKTAFFLPGQSSSLQGLFWTGFPAQVWPPLTGLGFVHARVRFWLPFPHWLEQADQADHVDQSPSTET
jgi:hypothetical protein